MAKRSGRVPRSLHNHALTLATASVLLAWIILYRFSDPGTHWGSFFGNAIADWSGVLVMILATKHLYEKGSAESRKPPHPLGQALPGAIVNHSLTIFLLITGAGWVALFCHLNSEGKWGQVVGNIVSEWTQIIGLVLLTKKLVETKSKESR